MNRRQFLQRSAAVSALAAGPVAGAADDPKKERLRPNRIAVSNAISLSSSAKIDSFDAQVLNAVRQAGAKHGISY